MMKPGKEQTLFIQAGFLLFFFFIFWLVFAPSQLGGPLTYVIVNGNSMEPGFFRGDLVLVRREPAYGVGDAVVYSDPNMRQYVFHRIMGMELDRFILQGDNNDWLDSYHPASGEIVGKLWLHIPKFGKAIEWMRMPVNAAMSAGLFGVLLMTDLFKKSPRTRRESGTPSIRLGAAPRLSLVIFGVSTILFFAFGIFSFTRPVDLPPVNIPYQQTGDYYYSATGTPGVYDSDIVQTGEPVFPKLTCYLNIGFTYTLTGDGIQNVMGSHSMYARILDRQSGWQRTIPLYPETPFNGTTNFTMATLNLCEVESLVNLVEAQTGLKQIAYTLEIVNDVNFAASMNGQVVSDTISPVMTFNYDKIHFFLAENGGVEPLHTVKAGMAGSTTARINSLSVFGLALPVWSMRLASVFGFIVSTLGLGMAGMRLYQDASQTENGLFQLKYGGMIVNVHEQNLEPYSVVVDVDAMDDLARLADRQDGMILHMQRNFLHYYFVQSNGTMYRYVVTGGKKGVAALEELEDVQSFNAQHSALEPEPAHVPPAFVPEPEPAKKEERIERQVYELLPRRVTARHEVTHKVEKPRERIKQAPVLEEALNYVIDTGEINFYVPQQEETCMIERVRF